jgi:deoxyribodipyrimidine photo-lyase
MTPPRALAWYRGRDLRVVDQPILAGGDVLPIFILEPETLAAAGPFRGPLLKRHLQALREALRGLGSELVLLEGRPEELLPVLARRWQAGAVRTLRTIDPAWRVRDLELAALLAREGVAYEVLEGDTLVAPGALRTVSGGPFRVFTPFAKAFRNQVPVPAPWPAPERLAPLPPDLQGQAWPWPQEPSAPGPGARLAQFLDGGLRNYATGRDLLGEDGTSRLSVELAFGTLSVRTLWLAVQGEHGKGFDSGVQAYLNELLWREFAHHTLWTWPELVAEPFRTSWRGFPWRRDPAALDAWKAGRTGYALVDAAARELLATGLVHNRARMIAATFLTKHLLLDWREGEAHYRRYLADYDPASDVMGWQWCAGCGVDAQPWFRIFNPETQAKRFDARGDYVRRWVPEPLAPPIVSLAEGRARFLAVAKGHLG